MTKISNIPDLPNIETYIEEALNNKKRGFRHMKYSNALNLHAEVCEALITRLKQELKNSQTCPEAGKEIRFRVPGPVPQDSTYASVGFARYLVASLKPIHLIHLNVDRYVVGDAYQFPYVHRLTASDIRAEIKKLELMPSKKLNPKFSSACKMEE